MASPSYRMTTRAAPAAVGGGWWDRHQRRLAPLLMLTPAIALFSCLVAWPILASIRLSLVDWDGVGEMRFVGLANYRELFADPIFLRALANNALWVLCFLAAPLAGLCLAIFLNQRVRGIRLWRTLLLFPFVISQAAVGLIFGILLNSQFGWVVGNGAPGILESDRTAIFGVILAALWPQVSYCMILFLAGMTELDAELVDAARIDGAHGWRLFRRIVVPQLRPTTIIAVIVSFVAALRSFDLVSMMTNGGPADGSMVLALYMYQQTFLSLRYGYGAAIAVVLFVLMNIGVAFFLSTILRRRQT
jgi:multiple sugar transport system permease protein